VRGKEGATPSVRIKVRERIRRPEGRGGGRVVRRCPVYHKNRADGAPIGGGKRKRITVTPGYPGVECVVVDEGRRGEGS